MQNINRNLTIKDLNNFDKPREHLLVSGGSSLTDYELLAIILRSGGKDISAINLASQLLNQFQSLKNLLKADMEQLRKTKHIGLAKAASIKAIYEIAARSNFSESEYALYVKKPEDVYKILKRYIYEKDKEYLYLLSIDARNKVIATDLISIGTVNETFVHPREIYKQALFKNAVAIILAHNHPSDNPNPSKEDILVTERVAKVGISLGIPLLDHLVVCDSGFVSMKVLKLFNVANVTNLEKSENNGYQV